MTDLTDPGPADREGTTIKVEITSPETGHTAEGYITANHNPDGSLREVFLTGFGKSGSTLEGWVQFSAMLFSMLVNKQTPEEFEALVKKVQGMKFEPYGRTNFDLVPECTSVPDFIVRYLSLNYVMK